MRKPTLDSLFFLAASTLVASPALASFTVTYSPPFHGAPCTQYAGWETFTQANISPNAPDDPSTTSPGAAVYQLALGGVITGAGNLDNLTIPPVYRVTDGAPADVQEVVLQVCNLLNPLNWASFTLSYTDASSVVHTLSPTSSTYLLHAMGHDERVITWDLSSIADTILAYTIDFGATNSFTTLDAVKLDQRYACGTAISFCVPGAGGVSACPCTNPPAGTSQGCNNSAATGGASIAAAGTPALASDTLVLTSWNQTPNGTTIVLQGDLQIVSTTFGQGVRCIGGALRRLYVKSPGGSGGISAPSVGDPSISGRSAALGDPIAGGAHRYYMTYYRDPAVLGGCPAASTFNATQALDVTWQP